MIIFVDADACPVAVKEILFRAANRAQIQLTLVANQTITVPNSPYISAIRVMPGFDVADNEIVSRVSVGDLVITADIPLADEVIEKGASALSPRGDLYTKANIKGRLAMRNFMTTMRDSGVETGGQAAFNHTDRQNFANQLDRLIAKSRRA